MIPTADLNKRKEINSVVMVGLMNLNINSYTHRKSTTIYREQYSIIQRKTKERESRIMEESREKKEGERERG